MLSVEDLYVSLNRRPILQGVNLAVGKGEVVVLLGGNASGKTTTLKSILGLYPLGQGRVVFEGENMAGQPPERIVSRGVAMVPENRRLFPAMSIEENLLIVLHNKQPAEKRADS